MKFLLLSYPLNNATSPYGNNPKPIITPYSEITKGDSANSFLIHLHNHTGTHVDAPRHFILDGKAILDYSLKELIFDTPSLLDCPIDCRSWVGVKELRGEQLDDVDCLLLRTGFDTHRGTVLYSTASPGISPEAILYIRKNFPKIRCIGIDSLSISCVHDRATGRRAHLAAFERHDGLGEPLLLLEDINLSAISLKDKLTRIIVLPWQIYGVDSAPCTIMAEIEERRY